MPSMCHLVARDCIRWQHLIFLFIYIVQLYKEDWGILRMLGCRAVALPSTEQIVLIIGNPDKSVQENTSLLETEKKMVAN